MEMKALPFITIILPVKPGGHAKALDAVRQLDYPRDRLEVFVVEGCQPSRQRNLASNDANGTIFYFLDDDACPGRDNLLLIARHFENPDVAVLGGPSLTPESDSSLQKSFDALFCSPLGGAGIRNRYRKVGSARDSSEKELILCNLSFRADVYKELGGLNEKLYPNEENELMVRIANKGYKLIHDPEFFVFRSQRETLSAFIKQILNYGRGRMEQTFIAPSSFQIMHFIPLCFLIYLVSIPIIGNHIYAGLLVCYVILVSYYSLKSICDSSFAGRNRMKRFTVLFFLFPVMHLSYGIGMVLGLIRHYKNIETADDEIKIKTVSVKI